MKKSLLGAVAAVSVLFSACGTDNVGACNRWKEAVKCGTSSAVIDSAVNCDLYKETKCDISEYFDCLSTAYVCTNGTYDPTKLANISSCASKAVCK